MAAQLYKRVIMKALLALAFLTPALTYGADLDEFFNELGMYNNISGPGAYQSQAGNFYSGGSVFIRAPVRNYQFASFSPPRLKGGCGGIDAYLGSFSHINADQFIALLKNIGANALGYAFDMALTTICPSCAQTLSKMETISRSLNNLNVNSCEAAQALVRRDSDYLNRQYQTVAAVGGAITNMFTDVNAASNATKGDPLALTNTVNTLAAADPSLQEELPDGNVTLRALLKVSGLTDDQRQLYLNFVGTYVYTRDTTTGELKDTFYPPIKVRLADLIAPSTINAGVKASLHYCLDEDGVNFETDPLQAKTCLTMAKKDDVVLADKGYQQLVYERLYDIVSRIRSNQEQTPENIVFVGSTSIPVFKMSSVAAAMPSEPVRDTMIRKYSDSVAAEMSYAYIDDKLDVVEKALLAHKRTQQEVVKKKIDEMVATIRQRRASYGEELMLALEQSKYTVEVANELQAFERKLLNNIPANLSNALSFGGKR